ncbi:OmpP1/FadL family transporter [Rhodopirellula sp. SWK7]|uniref:OmpP1/FadL family transporter n=1 Tax=Rhodopirellula sp. SWK7 TaxID=595460 RepID=UPI0002BF0EE5|nr:outer membrane protein transport protein [Rhodopirellula sp. SWK7]EMI47144.1 membrane protein involved in aromatic hydrocarbon degradation [Rhodopirellula sp. SWK7]
MSTIQRLTRFFIFASVAAVAALSVPETATGQGIYLTGVGPVNRSMAGAGTAAPLDAVGALAWNPASISGLANNEVGFGVELLFADVELTSSLGGGTEGDAGAAAVPSIGWVHRMSEDSRWTVGLGLAGVAGFTNNQPAGNPVLGGAPAYAASEFLQIAPTVSFLVTEKLSIGFAPLINLGEVGFDPIGPSVITPTAETSQGNRKHWGIGFQAGMYYITDNHFHFGASFRSTQWMETFRFFTPSGLVKFDLDLPMIVSLGTAYTGFEDWTFAADFRYIGYDDADGFSELGWSNLFAAAFGVQKRMSDRIYLRCGINFNQPPIHESDVATNVISPLIQKYNVATGGSYRFAKNVDLNMSYVYLGHNSLTGTVPTGGGPVTVRNDVSAHSLITGITVRY